MSSNDTGRSSKAMAQSVISFRSTLQYLKIHCRGEKIDKKSWKGTDSYLEVHKWSNNNWHRMDKTDVVRKSVNPSYDPVTIKIAEFEKYGKILFKVINFVKEGKPTLIGEAEASFADVKAVGKGKNKVQMDLLNDKRKGGNNAGILWVD